ncbi:RNase A-like domain-containing protein [Paenibacillus lentus]|uniref:RNase A-like domain-containing protein n=1 Tax=Paenibacillus lentus TaxID=1338368 RepID=UPI00365546A4
MLHKVEPGRIGGLARDLERLERTMENGITGMSRELRRLASDVEAAYTESSEHDVRSTARKVSGLLQEIEKLAERIDEQMREKVQALRYAEREYIKAEKDAAKASVMKKPSRFTLKGAIQSWFQRFRDKVRQNVSDPGGSSSAESRPSLLQWIKGTLLEIKDASLIHRLEPVKEDERIASLLQILDTGSAEEQAWARQELETIAKAFEEIARSQAAYKMYAMYDHELYMGYAHKFAEQQREKLTKLGVSEEWYKTGIRLAEFYKGSPLDACDYNPLKQDMSAMPKESELRLMIAAGMLNPYYREWAKLNYDSVAAAIHQKAERRRQMQELLDEYNQAIPAEDIRKMQQYLKNMNIYHGEVTGEYNQEFLVAVAGYQHIANTVSTMAAVRREWFGLEMFEVDGKITKGLLELAMAESGYGMRNNPNLNTSGLTAAVTIVGVGDGIVSQLYEDVKDVAEFAINSNPANLGFWTDTVPGYYAIGEAIVNGELTINDMKKLLGDAAAEEFVVPFQDIIELQPKVLSGKATYEESVKYGRALTKAFFALTVVEGAVRAGAKFSGKTVKELVKSVKEAAQTRTQTSLNTPDGLTIPVRDLDMPKTEPLFSRTKPDSGSSGGSGRPNISPDAIRKVDNDILDRMESAGGHTLDRHVSKTNEELIRRAIQEDVEAATSFNDKNTAIRAIQENLRKNADDIAMWLNESDTGRKIFDVSHKNPVGKGVLEDKKQVVYDLTDSRVVLIRDSNQELGFKILTFFPIIK